MSGAHSITWHLSFPLRFAAPDAYHRFDGASDRIEEDAADVLVIKTPVLEVSRQALMGDELTKNIGFVFGSKSNEEEEEEVEKATRQMCGLGLGRRRRRLRSLDGISSNVVAFLLYVQQWKKRIVFVLNKLDIYRNTSELEEATAFIKENTCNLLSVEDIRLYPVSAHSALEAKISASNYSKRSYDQLLSNDPRWATSRFYELEKFLFSFLDGSTEYGMERMRLKLETPIGIADRLLSFCVRLVKQDYENASQDLISIKEMVKSVDVCTMKMEQESRSWRKRVVSLIETARTRAIELVESTLQLSNVDIIATYTFKREGSAPLPVTSAVQNEIINPAITDAQGNPQPALESDEGNDSAPKS
ncbi:uncharacterized protein A4U43_C08F20720 [Asparagus officinalis]|nr:uncharacterized protein A4U43_C08F20720 [Asparagus officinalis]